MVLFQSLLPNCFFQESFMAHLRSSYADQIAELEGENQYLRDSLKELQTQLNVNLINHES
jgi:hypothetical protein